MSGGEAISSFSFTQEATNWICEEDELMVFLIRDRRWMTGAGEIDSDTGQREQVKEEVGPSVRWPIGLKYKDQLCCSSFFEI